MGCSNCFACVPGTNRCVPSRDAPILLAEFLEKYDGKSKEQNAGKISENLEK